ncbi:MAG: PLP-dependent aminotransferase family protein [Brachymonas sp.]|nr:PLP-dependent aminotransferase family protein [Brachymonas sp.]
MDTAIASEKALLRREAGVSLADQLAAVFAQRIHAGQLAPGARLPSVRQCAGRYGVSAHTVVAAYDQLLAQGLVLAERHRGFFVRERVRQAGLDSQVGQDVSANAAGGEAALVPNDVGSLIRTMFPNGTGSSPAGHEGALPPGGVAVARLGVAPRQTIKADAHRRPSVAGTHAAQASATPSPASGVLPVSWLDEALLTKALRRAIAQDAGANGAAYGTAQGDPHLRDMLAQHIAQLGVVAPAAQIVTTAGATHALDVVAHTLLQPGDAVLVDAPGWSVEFARLQRLGVRLLPVPRGTAGVDVEALEQLAAQHRPKLYTTVSVLHNPTGHSLGLAQAHRVLQLAEKYDFHIVEDDTYASFAAPHSPRYAALDGLQRTFYITGFAKIFAPGWRVGGVAAPQRWVEQLLDTKLIAGLNTPTPTERALAICLQQGWLRRHAESVGTRLDAARNRTMQLAAQHQIPFAAPPQGLFGWLDAGVDTETLAQRLLDHDWLIAPGHLFYPYRTTSTCMRINFAAAQDAAFWQCLAQERAKILGV